MLFRWIFYDRIQDRRIYQGLRRISILTVILYKLKISVFVVSMFFRCIYIRRGLFSVIYQIQLVKKMKQWIMLLAIVLIFALSLTEAQQCHPSGKLRGRNPPKSCDTNNNSECCKEGVFYNIYKCSPPVSSSTRATLTLNSFAAGGEGGGPSECDNKYHDDNTPVVALSTGWFNNMKRCGKFIIINANGKSTRAKVVDECDSTEGCDQVHAYQPPCQNDIVDASKAVWKSLGVSPSDPEYGYMQVTWTDA